MTAAERKTLFVGGRGSSMTAVFGTPVAAVLLPLELLLFEWRPRSFLPVALACAVAGFARAAVFGTKALFPLKTTPPYMISLLSCLVSGLLSGALASGLSASLYKLEDLFHKLPIHWMWWPAIGAVFVGIGGYLEPRALGASLTAIVFAFGLTHDANALLPLLAATLVAHGFATVVMRRSIMTEKSARRGYHIYREYGVDPLERHHVDGVMTRDVRTIAAATPLCDVLAQHFGPQQKHRAYPVVRDGALIGMLDRAALDGVDMTLSAAEACAMLRPPSRCLANCAGWRGDAARSE